MFIRIRNMPCKWRKIFYISIFFFLPRMRHWQCERGKETIHCHFVCRSFSVLVFIRCSFLIKLTPQHNIHRNNNIIESNETLQKRTAWKKAERHNAVKATADEKRGDTLKPSLYVCALFFLLALFLDFHFGYRQIKWNEIVDSAWQENKKWDEKKMKTKEKKRIGIFVCVMFASLSLSLVNAAGILDAGKTVATYRRKYKESTVKEATLLLCMFFFSSAFLFFSATA